MLKRTRIIALFITFVLSLTITFPAFAQEDKDVSITHNLPETVKIGELVGGIFSYDEMLLGKIRPDYKITFNNLTPGAKVVAYCEIYFNSAETQLDAVSFMDHAGDAPIYSVDTNGNVTIMPLSVCRTFFEPGVITLKPVYQYLDSTSSEPIGDLQDVGTPITIQIEEPVIKNNAPTNIKVGDTLQFTTELTNTALANKDTAYYLDENNYSKGVSENGNQWGMLNNDDIHDCHEPTYLPSVEVLEGKELVKQTNQDYTNTLKSSETLSFTGTGMVKLRVKYNQFITCIDCQSVYDENYKQTGEYYTYNPEKIITIEVTGETIIPENENNIKYYIPESITINGDSAFPSGTVVKAETLTKGTLYEQAQKALSRIATKFTVFDINATNNGKAIQPNGKVSVSFTVPDGYGDDVALYYVADDGTANKIAATFDKESRILTAELEYFSIYVLADENAKPTTNIPTSPQTGDTFNFYPILIVMVVSGAVIYLTARKRIAK